MHYWFLIKTIITILLLFYVKKEGRNKGKGKFGKAYLPTLPVFPGVSKFFIKSPDLPVRA